MRKKADKTRGFEKQVFLADVLYGRPVGLDNTKRQGL